MTADHFSNAFGFRLGILGGMGAAAGVYLQKRIIDLTPAARDQDHIEVVCFTNPHITDRTWSLNHDGGSSYLRDVVSSLQILEGAGATHLVITCNTAYVRYDDIVHSISKPLIHIVHLTKEELARSPVATGLLGTDWTVRSGIYSNTDSNFSWHTLPEDLQARVMEVIYLIKAGDSQTEKITSTLCAAVDFFISDGADRIVLGCTELSLYREFLAERYPRISFVDPLDVVARAVVAMTCLPGTV